MDGDERKLVDSPAFQRLRSIHQLALTYLVYPGATHRRFEHSLGVMELATRVYDAVTRQGYVHEGVSDFFPGTDFDHQYWRRVLRMAALCHDMGHLPFSHAAERELLPEGWNHERLTKEIVLSDELSAIWDQLSIKPTDVAKIAVGPEKYGEKFNDRDAVLSEIITGDAFGVDRMDYLLRDSLHCGVAYGRFDYHRLIGTLRILPRTAGESLEPALGIEGGGLHAAESLLLARFFMFTQLYYHDVRRIYDLHLKDFLKSWLPGGAFPITVSEHLNLTDNQVSTALADAARDSTLLGHDAARRIARREHFKLLWDRNPTDFKDDPEAGRHVAEAAVKEFGEQNVRRDSDNREPSPPDFPVLRDDGRIESSLMLSKPLNTLPSVVVDYVFVAPELRERAQRWLVDNRDEILQKGAS